MFIELIVGLNNPNTLEDTRVMSTQSVSHVLFLVFLSVFLVFMKIFVAHFWQHFCMFHYVLCPAPPGRIYYAVRRGFRSNSSTSIGGHGNDVVAILHPAVTRATYCQIFFHTCRHLVEEACSPRSASFARRRTAVWKPAVSAVEHTRTVLNEGATSAPTMS